MARRKRLIGWKMAWVTTGRTYHTAWTGLRWSDPKVEKVVLKLEILGRVVKPYTKALTGLGKLVTKFRTDKVRVLSVHRHYETPPHTKVSGRKTANSDWSSSFRYYVGRRKEEPYLNIDPHIDCGPGIHFFKSRKAAEHY